VWCFVARRNSLKRENDINRVGSDPLRWTFILPLALVTNIIVAIVAWRLVGLLLG
jgi:hypothetical protein